MKTRRTVLIAAALLAGGTLAASVLAQPLAGYPGKPIKFIVPYALGACQTPWLGCLRSVWASG